MVTYKLGLFDGKEERIIDISELIQPKSLEELDSFTQQFENEGALKTELFKRKLINSDEIRCKLWIMYKASHKNKKNKSNGEFDKIPVAYKDMKKYLNDELFLRATIQSLSQNSRFLKDIEKKYNINEDKNGQRGNTSVLRQYRHDVENNGGNYFFSQDVYDALDNILQYAITKEKKEVNPLVKELIKVCKKILISSVDETTGKVNITKENLYRQILSKYINRETGEVIFKENDIIGEQIATNPQKVTFVFDKIYSRWEKYNTRFVDKNVSLIIDLWQKKLKEENTTKIKTKDYRGMRDIASIAYKYKNNLETKEDWNQVAIFYEDECDAFDPESFDEPEPEFTPNSEEEENYLKYLEELEEMCLNEDIENHDHYRR